MLVISLQSTFLIPTFWSTEPDIVNRAMVDNEETHAVVEANQRKKRVRNGHKLHLLSEFDNRLESELLALKDCLERKMVVIKKIDEELLETMKSLFSVLVQFRYHKVALVADIEKAFLSIGIREEDQTRFLWVDDPFVEEPEIREMRFVRVCFGIISSMGYLGVLSISIWRSI